MTASVSPRGRGDDQIMPVIAPEKMIGGKSDPEKTDVYCRGMELWVKFIESNPDRPKTDKHYRKEDGSFRPCWDIKEVTVLPGTEKQCKKIFNEFEKTGWLSVAKYDADKIDPQKNLAEFLEGRFVIKQLKDSSLEKPYDTLVPLLLNMMEGDPAKRPSLKEAEAKILQFGKEHCKIDETEKELSDDVIAKIAATCQKDNFSIRVFIELLGG